MRERDGITEGPEPYRPQIALWMEMPEGLIVGQDMLAPGDEPGALGRALQDRPRCGTFKPKDGGSP